MSVPKLSVTLFGGFSARYGDIALSFGEQANSKFRQLFQILMTKPGEGFSKAAIIENIYEPGEVEEPNASLNNTIFRLRKYLKQSPLPPGEYLIMSGGIIRFAGPVEVESDVWSFEKLSERFDRERDAQKKESLCEQACELYQGEFLAQLSNEPWVIQKNRYYQTRYAGMLRYLLERLREKGDYVSIQRLTQSAARLESNSEWQIWEIDSLSAQGRHREALHLYTKTLERMQEQGISPARGLLKQFEEVGKRLQTPDGTMEGIYQCLQEETSPQGAYCYTLPSFLDTYRVLKRLEGRSGLSFLLILCTIQRGDGRLPGRQVKWENQGEKLREVFARYLRVGDAYVRYNANQYLLLCLGAQEEDLPEIIMRIDTDFQKRCQGRYMLHYHLLDSMSWR